jgi:hypothetical protein
MKSLLSSDPRVSVRSTALFARSVISGDEWGHNCLLNLNFDCIGPILGHRGHRKEVSGSDEEVAMEGSHL